MSDTLMRQWHMLRLIPRHPSKITTAALLKSLSNEGFETSQRTIQRDLMGLSSLYPLECDERSKPYGWSWKADARVLDIPGMDTHAALTFWLAEKHLEALLPKTTLNHIQPHFTTAAKVLDHATSRSGVPTWRGKVRVFQRGPGLNAAKIDHLIETQVYEALLSSRRLSVVYQTRWLGEQKVYEINPLGLVLKDGVSYLVCSMWDYADIRLLTLHRIQSATLLNIPANAPEGFDLDAYIESGELSFSIGSEINLKILVSKDVAFHLSERELSANQTISQPLPNGLYEVSATLQDTSELRWWLLGFGDQIEVIGPPVLREMFSEVAANMASAYLSEK